LKGKAKMKRFHENPPTGEHMAIVSLPLDTRQHAIALFLDRLRGLAVLREIAIPLEPLYH
jgi:hypothetical protein